MKHTFSTIIFPLRGSHFCNIFIVVQNRARRCMQCLYLCHFQIWFRSVRPLPTIPLPLCGSLFSIRMIEFNPHWGCLRVVLHRPRVSPEVIDIQALRAFPNNSEFICLTYWAATKSCPYLPFGSDPFNLEYQTLLAMSLLSPLSVLNSSLFTLHFSLFTFHSSLFTFHFSLFTLHSSLFTFFLTFTP